MSIYEDGGFKIPSAGVRLATPDENAPLTPELKELQRRLFSNVETLPEKFKGWTIQNQAVNSDLVTQGQVQGLPLLNSQVQDALDQLQSAVDAIAVIGTTYQNSFTAEVLISNGVQANPIVSVPAGTYYCILSAQGQVTDGTGFFTIQLYNVSGAAGFGSVGKVEASSVPGPVTGIMSIGSVSVTGTSNDIKMICTRSGAGNRRLSNCTLIALRTA